MLEFVHHPGMIRRRSCHQRRRYPISTPFLILFLVFTVCTNLRPAVSKGEDLTVLPFRENQAKSEEMMRAYLRSLSRQALDQRLRQYDSLVTVAQIEAHQDSLRNLFVEELGGFPERSPLRAQVTGRHEFEQYVVENVIYESQPNFHVTANLYLPRRPGPHPAVLVPCGHDESGKLGYQHISILLAKNGIAALCFDPIGQGERKQILDLPDNEAFPATTEHMICGISPIPLGKSLATYMIWDGIRGIDYLVSRPDIDPMRIGCTGNSGGGNMTSYLMALDPRIHTAAPSCFITTTRLKNESPGPGDAEQNIHAQIAHGLDHPDYILLRAPKPTLILAATRDFVPIEGAWDAFRQAKRIYTRFGFPERVTIIETDQPHGFSIRLREGSVRWMRRWLMGHDDPIEEIDFQPLDPDLLRCTPEGQVLRLKGARSIFDLNRASEKSFAEQRVRFQQEKSPTELRNQIRQLTGIRDLDTIPKVQVERGNRLQRTGYQIQKLTIHTEPGIVLPALQFIPESPNGRVVLYLNDKGKHVDALPGGQIESLVSVGDSVLAVDLRGRGETATTTWRYNRAIPFTGTDVAEFFIAYMLDRTFVGMRTEDILACAQFLSHSDLASQGTKIDLIAIGTDSPPALHAAALHPELFQSIMLHRSLVSWSNVVQTKITRDALSSCVHGSQKYYDLPDLVTLAGPKRVFIKSQVDASGKLISTRD